MDIIIRRQSEQFKNKYKDNSNSNRIFYDKKWEWGFLRKQCQNLELEQFYKTYMQRLQRSYLSIFIIIQFLVGGVHSVVLLIIVENKNSVYPEIFSYLLSILLVWASLFITFREDFIKRWPFVAYIASFTAIFILVVADLLVPLYHAYIDFPNPALRPAYPSYILFAIYIFIPLSENWHALILGLAVSVCYILNFVMITYRLEDEYSKIIKTTSEGIFLLCVNFFGIYFRLMKEIAIRTTFLDRRQCVEENLLLRYARDEEKCLLLSIIPAHTVDDLEREIRERIEQIKTENLQKNAYTELRLSSQSIKCKKLRPDTAKLFVDAHADVSILYADVVNYTYLTTTLDVEPLVETLHELFVKFDQASEEYNCLRIKFLGDCYYCVSGIPVRNDHHAKSCVDLGLRMIRDIREVRSRRKLNIDMRIGVHSGDVLSGVIGACKWQYDIWSKDVDIANRLESTGRAGRVHVSRETLDLLDGDYMYEEGTQEAKADEVLQKNKIETFLIKPHKIFYVSEENPRHSIGVRRMIENNHKTPKANDTVPSFMQNSIEQYNQIWIQAKLEMSRELDKMPIGKFHLSKFCFGSQRRLTQDEIEEKKFRRNVSTVFLFFKDIRWEYLFLQEPDVMLKYSCLIGLLTFCGIFALQSINNPYGVILYAVNGVIFIILIAFLPLTWYKKLWIVFSKTSDEETDDEPSTPKNKISKFFYDCSDKIMRSVIWRILIYLTVVGTLCSTSLLPLLKCSESDSENYNTFENIDDPLQAEPTPPCLNTWAITESLILTICVSFLFPRIPFLFKLLLGSVIVIIYAWIVMRQYAYIFSKSASTNLGLNAEASHIVIIIISFVIFHLMDRQNEYIAKVDYNWKRQLLKKQEDAEVTNETISILVQNILPAHVAEIYLARKMKDALYSEKYENVAIMFATIRGYDIEKVKLSVLNEIICEFDEILMSHKGSLKIEKIKISGWTYMAACGLDPGRCESTISFGGSRNIQGHRSSAILPNGRRSLGTTATNKRLSLDHLQVNHINEKEKTKERERKQSSKITQNPVFVMTEFAVKLMKTLRSFNTENFQNGMLRIGISHGKIMAGVVGSSKPLYDVWGNPVNMASRMDTTGIPGQIQITEDTAEVLKSFNIKCDYRGLTYVKGRDYIPTYFVCLDDNFNFIVDSESNSISANKLPSNSTNNTTKL